MEMDGITIENKNQNKNALGELVNINFQFSSDSNSIYNLNNQKKNIFEKKGNLIAKGNFDIKNIFGNISQNQIDQINSNLDETDIQMEVYDETNKQNTRNKTIINENSIKSSSINKQKEKKIIIEEKLSFEDKFRKEFNVISIFG